MIFPAAVAAAGVRDHHVVSAVGQQLHFRHRRVRAGEDAHRRFRDRRQSYRKSESLGGVGIERRGLGHPLLEQQRGRLEQRIRLESPLHRPIQQQIGQRQQAHALVMRHERANHGADCPRGRREGV